MDRIFHGCLAVLLSLLVGCSATASQSTQKPNIVYIFADDLGYGDIGVYGQEKIETPNIDALAQNGIRFTQHYAFPVCAPSRYLLMTGQNSGRAYIRGNDEMAERGDIWNFEAMRDNPGLEGQRPIPDSTRTIAELLKATGYQTAAVGKWGLGAPGTEGHPNNQGFDLFYGYLGQRQAHTYYPDHLWKNGERVFLDNELVDPHARLPDSVDPNDSQSYARYQNQPDYSAALMQDEMMKFIDDAEKDSPFFLYYATPIPHASLQAPKRWVDHYRQKFGEEKPYTGGDMYTPNRFPKATYAAMVSYLDEQVGKLIEKLKETGEYENTLIMFSSDNGPAHNGGTSAAYFNSAGPFKESYGWGKGFVHEGGIRVPMIASWEGQIEPGRTTGHISAIWDVVPTLADVAGTEPPQDIDGISFLSTLKADTTQQRKHEYLYWEFPAYNGQQAVRMGKWKGIRKNIMKGNMDIELYNLQNDLQEQQDVSAQHPDIVDKIERIMRREHTTPALDSFRMEALEENE